MADQLTTDSLWQALAGEFCTAVEAVVGRRLVTGTGPAPTGAGWCTPMTASGLFDGAIAVWVDEAGVVAVARAAMGMEDAPEPSVAADLLKQLWAQATAAVVRRDGFAGVTLVQGATTAGTVPAADAGVTVADGAATLLTLSMTGTLVVHHPGAGAPSARAGGAGTTRAEYPGNLAALLDIDLPLVVRFARTEMSLRSLAQLGPGSMVDMGRSPDAPVQLLIGSQVIAEGEVVVVAGNYGVRITSLASAAERLKAMDL